jgi:hypothetical protein
MTILSVTVHFVFSNTLRDEKGMKPLQFCLSEPAPPDGTQALILLLFYLAFAIPFTFTLRLLLSL